jgi:hypothetical protein
MGFPPRGDPRRPLHLAIRSGWLLTSGLLALGVLGLWPLLDASLRYVPTGYYQAVAFAWVSGGTYLVFALYLRTRRLWAVTGLIVLATVHSVLLLLCVAIVFYQGYMASTVSRMIVWALWDGLLLVPLGILVKAMAEFIYNLAKSYAAIRFELGTEPRGFEPIMHAQPKPAQRPIQALPLDDKTP